MEMLTRKVNISLSQGIIQGVRLATTAPPLTNILYADGLVIMGRANLEEAREYRSILDKFGSKSGLFVNPQKSKVWYSKKCDDQCKQMVEQELGARQAETSEKYLGIYMSKDDTQHSLTHDMLVDRFVEKLASWKTNTLSHEGRMTLIKSVLTSIPVYYMTVEKLPPKTVQQLTAIMRRFFWGKLQQDKYVSMVAWHKICREWEEGDWGSEI